ncbi:MAG: DUF4147 domain-containing protein [Nitrospirae bacterium]|nr:DUF4147 domain-containing protein [Nitrospirota bacterium]
MTNGIAESIVRNLRTSLPSFFTRISPVSLVEDHFRRFPPPSDLPPPEALISLGKAAGGLTISLSRHFGIPPEKTLSVLPTGYPSPPSDFPCLYGPHPLPDRQSLLTLEGIQDFVHRLSSRTSVLVAISGGSSSLVADPVPPVTIEEKALVTRKLMNAGAPIEIINTLRIHLSRIKGGGLASLISPRPSLAYTLSDIPGISSGLVGSSLMAPVRRDGPRMLAILEEWLKSEIPDSIRSVLNEGSLPDFSAGLSVQNRDGGILASSDTLLSLGQEIFIDGTPQASLPRRILTGELKGEAREAGRVLASLILWQTRMTRRGSVWLCSGETTVQLGEKAGPGRGGRSLELGLSLASALSGIESVVLSLATDGWDGNSSLAGMIAISRPLSDPFLLQEAHLALSSHDTASFLERHGLEVRTGRTGTNLNDLLVVVVPEIYEGVR